MATPPTGPRRTQPRRRLAAYTGPPSYPAVPRWGFPMLAWRWPLGLPAQQRINPLHRAEAIARSATVTLWITLGVAVVATFAEAWRYVLLLISRSGALSRTALVISDALVTTAGLILWVLGVLSGIFVVLWGLRARQAAAERIEVTLARPDWQVITGVLVPGLNLLVPGSVLAELEHAVLVAEGARRLDVRPRPTLRVRLWWACWVATLVLGWLAFGWGFSESVQALADGVELHAVNNALAALLAFLTIRMIDYLMRLLAPADPTELPLLRVRAVHAAPHAHRATRPDTAAR